MRLKLHPLHSIEVMRKGKANKIKRPEQDKLSTDKIKEVQAVRAKLPRTFLSRLYFMALVIRGYY